MIFKKLKFLYSLWLVNRNDHFCKLNDFPTAVSKKKGNQVVSINSEWRWNTYQGLHAQFK